MEKVITAFVGYRPDLKHPFAVASSHNKALQYLHFDQQEKGFIASELPTFYGFVVKSADDKFRCVDRIEAFAIAKSAGQLLEDFPGNALESYMILPNNSIDFTKLSVHSEKVNSAFAGKTINSDVLL